MKTKVLLITFVFFFLLSFSFGRTYPFKYVSKPIASCKYSPWSTLGPDCKISLPILKPSEYKKYLNDLTYRRIYTVLRGASYKYGWDQGYGSHMGVDIATSLGTPVYSIGPGKVVFVGWKTGRGKVVVIQHKVNGKYVYSNYAHLNKIFVKFGQYVKEGQKIGEVGHTGNSRGNHLHFQIDVNQSVSYHPFWFYGSCKDGKNIIQIVNSNSCLPELEKYTVDPLLFLATNGAIIKGNVYQTKKPVQKISRKNMISYEEIRRQMLKEFLRTHKFTFHFPNFGVYTLGRYGYFTITLKDNKGRNYKDILPGDLKIIYDSKYFSAVSPRVLKILDGTRKVTFLPKRSGSTFFTVKLGDFVIYQKAIRILKPGQVIQPKYADIFTIPNIPYIGYPGWGIVLFKDKDYLNLINVPFKGVFYVTSKNKTITFCKSPPIIKYLNFFHCSADNMTKTLKFTYKDTIYGVLVFKFFSNSNKSDYLIVKDPSGKILASKKIWFQNIKLTNPNSPYAKDVYQACKKGLCLGLIDKGYVWVDKKLSKYEMKNLLRNMLLLLGKKVKIYTPVSEKFQYVTRKQFVEYLFALLGIKIKDYHQIPKYIDVRNEDRKFINEVIYLTRLGFSWKDRFANYYFQPEKYITVGEALYLTDFLLSKYLK